MKRLALSMSFVMTWSSGFVGTALAGEEIDWRGLLAWRYILTATLLLCACLLTRQRWRVSRTDLLRQCVLGLLAHVVFLGGVFGASAAHLDAGVSALVCALQPLLVTLVSRPLFGDHVRRRQVIGLLLGLAGVVCSLGGLQASAAGGIVLAFAALAALSTSAVLERRWQPDTSLLLSITIQTVVAAAAFTVLAAPNTALAIPFSASTARAVTWLVALSGLGGYCSYLACLRALGSSTTSVLLYLTPPVTTLWAWAMFGQQPGMPQWIGLAIALCAVGLAIPSSVTRKEPNAMFAHQNGN